MIGDLRDFYLGTPMAPKNYTYMCIPIALLPPNIMDHYNLCPLIHNGHIYVEIRWGMYGLLQASKLANIQLQQFLEPHGYHPCPLTPGLWTHTTQDICFKLVVDDFVIWYTAQTDVQHYQVTRDWVASCKCSVNGLSNILPPTTQTC